MNIFSQLLTLVKDASRRFTFPSVAFVNSLYLNLGIALFIQNVYKNYSP